MKRFRGENPSYTKYKNGPWYSFRTHPYPFVPDKKSGKRLKARRRQALTELERKYPEYLAGYEAYSVPSKRFVRRYRRKGFHVSNITVMNLSENFIMALSVAE